MDLNRISLKSLETLEFPKVLQRLAQYTAFSASRDLALALTPSADYHQVQTCLARTAEARHLLAIKPGFSVGDAHDVTAEVKQATMGTILTPDALLRIGDTLTSARVVRTTLLRLADQVPELAHVAQQMVECTALEHEITRCVDEHGNIPDRASPQLKKIREEIKVAHDRLLTRLNEMLGSATGRLAVQEPIITVREGRYVIPVKADFKGQIRGLVHDTSASGATLFIEPLAVVELNNQWRQLQIEEEKEVERILRHLSGSVGALASEISADVAALAEIDLALAKAKYADATKAIEPQVLDGQRPQPPNPRTRLTLLNARHPLLSGKVVPISVDLGDQFTVMVVTGPNTGGKTVALKTMGLLVLMAQAGLAIPADEGSGLRLFDHVLADIGDEQSIEQSLSTFSAHVSNIAEILHSATGRSLVLLDEIGAGTDPAEGSALARAILTHLLERDTLTVATTHSNELKAFAHITDRVENASVEFDPETLAPTYRLLVGLPGRSNALAIAEKLGLPKSITDTARRMLSPSEVQVEQLLATIQVERAEVEVRAAQIEERQAELQVLQRDLQDRLREIEEEKIEAAEQARRETLAELADLRTRIRELNAAIVARSMDRTQLVNAAQEVEAMRQDVMRRTPPSRHRRRTVLPSAEQSASFRPGSTVFVRHLRQTGELLGTPDAKGEVAVQLGSFKARVSVDDLEPRRHIPHHSGSETPRVGYIHENSSQGRSTVGLDLDLRGKRADEVIPKLDQYLNDAYLAGLPFVRVIHGKGTGALRQVVRQQLTGHPLVRTYATAPPQEGGEGVTIATLAQ